MKALYTLFSEQVSYETFMIDSLQHNAHQPNHVVVQKNLIRSEDAQPPQCVPFVLLVQWQVSPLSP